MEIILLRSNTRTDDFHFLISNISYQDIENAIAEYLSQDDLASWMKELKTKASTRYFLIWRGETLYAKAICKAALRTKELRFKDWHTDPIIDALEHIGLTIWDLEEDGKYDQQKAATYETARRLARPGQQRFRNNALRLWGNTCAVSGVTVDAALEAAHIVPHGNNGSMDPRNSIVLRADLHRLFDAGLMAINPNKLKVSFSSKTNGSYRRFEGKKIKIPSDGPDASSFNARWEEFEDR